MPNPKRRHSKARTSKRRAHDHLTAQSLSECPNCHERKMPHRACPKCGYYKGREVVEMEEARARFLTTETPQKKKSLCLCVAAVKLLAATV